MNGQPNHSPECPPSANSSNIFTQPHNIIAIYTVLSILLKMRRLMGLEAMLEYIQLYLKKVEDQDHQLKPAVTRALEMMSLEKIVAEVRGQ